MATCVFCGWEGKLSNEHAWPDGLRKFIPHGTEKGHIQRFNISRADLQTYGKSEWRNQSARREVEAVCEKHCNGGWMSDLERAAQPILGPLIKGERVRLGTSQQRLIAFWAVKTAMMLQFTVDPHIRAVPAEHFAELYKNRQNRKPPRNTQVWLLSYARDDNRTIHSATGHRFPDRGRMPSPATPMNAYVSVMAIGHLVIHVRGHKPDGNWSNEQDKWEAARAPIFPAPRRPLDFPPREQIEDLNDLHRFVLSMTGDVPSHAYRPPEHS